GFLTSYGDAHGRKNLEDFEFFKKTKIPYSGRLDYDSEGLILFSNDGSLIHKLQTPKFDIEKEYIVYTNKPLKDEAIAEMENGLIIDGIRLKKCYISKIGRNKYKVIILEGKKRQIRKMFGYFKVEVERLIRVRIGNVTIDDLQVGEFKFLTKKELKGLKECIGLE
ncbi:MAG: pseudouridine synthase, partial [Deferribacterales bacterium]